MKKIIPIIITVMVIVGVIPIILLFKKDKTDDSENIKISVLSTDEKNEYSGELKIIMNFAKDKKNTVTITEATAEQIISFSHKNGYGTIRSLNILGISDYFSDDTDLNAWTVKVYTENNNFQVDIREDNGVIYCIKDEKIGKVYYSKNDTLNIDENHREDGIDWSDLKIKIGGIKYQLPCKIKDFIDKGWEFSDLSKGEKIKGDILPYNFVSVDLNNNNYTGFVKACIDNFENEIINGYESNITEIEIYKWNKSDKTLFDFYGITVGSTKNDVEEIFGTPDNINKNQYTGIIEYSYYTRVNEKQISVSFKFNSKDSQIQSLNIHL